MRPPQVERPGPLRLEVGPWSASVLSIVATVVAVVVVVMLANGTRKNNARAEDWRQRAVAAEEIAGGLRIVIGERSQTLNQRTRQANVLAATLASSRGALRETKVDLGALTRRQRELASEKARAETERKTLRAQRAALVSVSSALNACSQGLEALVKEAQRGTPNAVLATAGPQLAQCERAQARLSEVRENGG